jgi:hypothetical protein
MVPTLDGGIEVAKPVCYAYCLFYFLFTTSDAKTLRCGSTLLTYIPLAPSLHATVILRNPKLFIYLSNKTIQVRLNPLRLSFYLLSRLVDTITSNIHIAAYPLLQPVDPPLQPRDSSIIETPPFYGLHLPVRFMAFTKAEIINAILHRFLALQRMRKYK